MFLLLSLYLMLPLPSRAAEAPLTLEEAVRGGLQHSPTVARARRERDAAVAAAQKEAPRFDPAISLVGAELLNGPRITFPRGADGEATIVPRSRSRLEVTAATPLFHAGAGGASRRYRAAVRAADLTLQQALADVRREVKRAYFGLLAAEDGVTLARQGLEQARAHRALVETTIEAGQATQLDLLQADVEVETATAAVEDSAEARDLAAEALGKALGGESRPVALAPAGEPGPVPDEAASLASVEQRPDVRALAAQVEAAQAGARLARGQNLPSLDLAVGYALQTPSAFVARSSWSTGLSVTIPLSGGFRARTEAHEAGARAAEARAALEELRRGAALEIRQALNAVRSAGRRRAGAARATHAAEEGLRVAELQFQRGHATGLEVSTARASLQQRRLEEQRALYDWHMGMADLERAMGAPVAVDERR